MNLVFASVLGAIAGLVLAISFERPGRPDPVVLAPRPTEAKSELSGPFEGVLEYDFGDVAVLGTKLDLRHTFRLKNITENRVRISSTTASCSCTSATTSTQDVLPGGFVDISAVVSVQAVGSKVERVWLKIADQAPCTLTMHARVRSAVRLFSDRGSLDLVTQESDRCWLIMRQEVKSLDLPRMEIVNRAGWDITIGDWQLMWTPTEEFAGASRWIAPLDVRRPKTGATGTYLEFRMVGTAPLYIRIQGSPFR